MIVMLLMLPETRGRSLESLDEAAQPAPVELRVRRRSPADCVTAAAARAASDDGTRQRNWSMSDAHVSVTRWWGRSSPEGA